MGTHSANSIIHPLKSKSMFIHREIIDGVITYTPLVNRLDVAVLCINLNNMELKKSSRRNNFITNKNR
jgi:hypothetical protein